MPRNARFRENVSMQANLAQCQLSNGENKSVRTLQWGQVFSILAHSVMQSKQNLWSHESRMPRNFTSSKHTPHSSSSAGDVEGDMEPGVPAAGAGAASGGATAALEDTATLRRDGAFGTAGSCEVGPSVFARLVPVASCKSSLRMANAHIATVTAAK